MAASITDAPATPRAAIYTRISLDRTGEQLGVARQEQAARELVDARGWSVAGVWTDNSISASDARKNRPGYDALVKAYKAGQFDALVCFDLDRLTRQPRQLEDWIDAAEGRGLALVTLNGEADLTTDGGRMYARIKAAVARGEIERKGARQKAALKQRAERGKSPLGIRLTGYAVDGSTVPEEAEIVRRVFADFYAGESLSGLASQLTAEGKPTRSGRPWHASTVRGILLNPRYCGRVIYRQEVVDGAVGDWEPFVTPEVFDAIQARLTDPRRRNSHSTARKYLGSGLYRCGNVVGTDESGEDVTCGMPMRGWTGGAYSYRCAGQCISRLGPPIDEYVEKAVVARLRRPDIRERIAPPGADTAPLVAELDTLRARLRRTEADYDSDLIDARRYKAKTAKIETEIDQVNRALAGSRTDSALAEVLSAPDPGQAYTDLSLMKRRSIIDALMEVRLHRGSRGIKVFRPETVTITWRE